jgi:hypothetical protein
LAYEQGHTLAMQVDLVESGREGKSRSGWSHLWSEESRKLTARPFYLVRADERRIRVEPDARTSQLFDELAWKTS